MLPACELASLSPVHEDGIPDSPPEEYRHRRHWVLPLRMLLAGLLITALPGELIDLVVTGLDTVDETVLAARPVGRTANDLVL